MRLLYRSDPMRFAPAVVAYAHCRSERRKKGKKNERLRGGCMDCEELTPPGHPKGLPSSPMHLGGGAVVIRDSVERHVLGIGHPGLELGHDMVYPLFQEGPSGGQVGVWGGHRIDGWAVCCHFVKSDSNLGQMEVVVWGREWRNRCRGLKV